MPEPLVVCILHFAFCISQLHQSLPHHCAGTPTARLALDQLRRDITQATQAPGVQRGVWGIVVHSLDRDERLFELQPRTLLVPASVAKLAAVSTAAEAVGWDYRYETRLEATGPITDGVLSGDLLVVGSGDPTIGGRAGEDFSSWITALRAAGIRRIDGRIIGDDDAIDEPRPQLAWAWDDLGYPSGALFGALNYAENRMTVTLTPGPRPGAPVSIGVDPDAASRPIMNRVVTGAAGTPQQIWPEQRPGEPFVTIAGSIPAWCGAGAAGRRCRQSDDLVRQRPSTAAADAGHRGHRRCVGHRRRDVPAGPDGRTGPVHAPLEAAPRHRPAVAEGQHQSLR